MRPTGGSLSGAGGQFSQGGPHPPFWNFVLYWPKLRSSEWQVTGSSGLCGERKTVRAPGALA